MMISKTYAQDPTVNRLVTHLMDDKGFVDSCRNLAKEKAQNDTVVDKNNPLGFTKNDKELEDSLFDLLFHDQNIKVIKEKEQYENFLTMTNAHSYVACYGDLAKIMEEYIPQAVRDLGLRTDPHTFFKKRLLRICLVNIILAKALNNAFMSAYENGLNKSTEHHSASGLAVN